ncbi:hypothetical protein QTP70_028198 [Hemibagrus guttatus]|uniref:Uncharacterized protein n=1 Tax=Hemibagrus guttatus TaxID=175788 RepID=A0AAE0US25_9TELE|nr:hypothetical protein QTP70_028198 [Hemibagrus guttatus]
MFCWDILGPGIHADVTLSLITYLNIVADQVCPFMATVFPKGSGLFQQDPATLHKLFRNDLNPIKHLWDVLDKQVRSMEALPPNV